MARTEEDLGVWAKDRWEGSAMAVDDGVTVYREIRASILDGTYQAGHRLVEADLVSTFNSGRFYVRSALAQLAHDGLVERVAGRSSVVREVPLSELIEILDARIALESMVAQVAADRRTSAQATKLRKLAVRLEDCAAEGDMQGVLELQAELHHTVIEASCFRAMPRIIENLAALTTQTRTRTMFMPGRVAASVAEHRAISEAVAAGDQTRAGNAMAAHLRNVKTAIITLRGRGVSRKTGRAAAVRPLR